MVIQSKMSEENFNVFFAKLQKEIMEQEIKEFNEYIVNLFRKILMCFSLSFKKR